VRISNLYLPEIISSEASTPNEISLPYYIHSSFPVTSDSVFFGPDTYLFLSLLRAAVTHIPTSPTCMVDVCCGSGAGAIHMALTYPQAHSVGLDLNPRALELGRVNAESAGAKVDFCTSNLYAGIPDHFKSHGVDVIVANPPYIASSSVGDGLPTYADGGAAYGLDLSIRIVEDGMNLLSADGVIVIYTAVAILKARPGHDMWLERLKGFSGLKLEEYRIIHPDMWSEEIGKGAYKDVGRIQAVGAVLRRR
jgi:methylase of polypeptide subunit release factors